MIETLTEENLPEACRRLATADVLFSSVIDKFGPPPLWRREPDFGTLVRIILEQQVSLASANAAFERLRRRVGEIIPERILALGDDELRECYFSRQKSSYVRDLAGAVADGRLDLGEVELMEDEEARQELKKIKGIGDWTADIYLLMALCRPDVMPKGDLALHIAYRNLHGLEKAPHSDEFQSIAERWKPLRAVAARVLWHFYLSSRTKR